MASTKAKSAQNGGGAAGKKAKSSAPSTGTSTPVTTVASASLSEQLTTYGSGKPEKALYDAEQNKIKADIDALQVKLNAVKDKIGSSNRGGPGQERRSQLLDELKEIRNAQGNIKQTRNRIFEQLKQRQETIKKRTADLNSSRAKLPFKTRAEFDEAISKLEKQVESGTMKVVDEKRALADISHYKRNRRIVEGFDTEQDTIDAERAQAEELKKQLDDPEGKAMSERYDAIQAELDALKAEGDKAHDARGKLLDERSELQRQLDALYNQKRESAQRYRDANDQYWAKVNEDRARRAERMRQQRAEEEERKKKEVADRIREEAEVPAFQAQIEDCQTLIDYFSGGSSASAPAKLSTDEKEKHAVAGVPQLELRKVEAGPSDGMVVRKKKGEDESYFVGGGGKKKGRKHTAKGGAHADANNGAETSGDRVNVPLSTLSALLSLSIPPPASSAELARVVEDLKTKKAWFEANQARVTAENKAKAEKEIQRLTGKPEKSESASPSELVPPSGGGELPMEPASTPAVAKSDPSIPVSDDEVEEKLGSVKESAEGDEQRS